MPHSLPKSWSEQVFILFYLFLFLFYLFFQFCVVATHSGIMIDHPQVELAKFGYRPKEESAKR